MAVTLNAKLSSRLARELSGTTNNPYTYEREALDISLSDTTAIVVDTVWGGTVSLVANAATVDLTALATTNLAATDMTGKNVKWCRIVNLGANPMTFKEGASNGYNMFTATDGHIVGAGGQIFIYEPDGFEAVATGARTIDVSGTGTQSFWIEIAAGTVA